MTRPSARHHPEGLRNWRANQGRPARWRRTATVRFDRSRRRSRIERAEGKDVDKRIARLVAAIETGGDAVSLIAKLRELEARRQAINVEGASLHPVPRLEPAVIEDRLAEWRRLLRQSTTQGRTVLQRILRGRLTFTPQIDRHSGEMVGYNFEGPTRFDKLFAGIAGARPRHVDRDDRSGTEHIGQEDTFEGDYGRLLDRFYTNNAEGMASPRRTSDMYRRRGRFRLAA